MIKSISIRNWKGHNQLHLDFIEGINFLVGPNAVGKTSVLEAICLALLGDLSASPIYGHLSFKRLIRDPDQDMQIRLTFSPAPQQEWIVTRRCVAATGHSRAELSTNSQVITKTWDGVTQRIMALFETSQLFFTKVIFLSEGDTFEYSARPPGEALTRHIESVLGLRRLDDLRTQLNEMARQFKQDESAVRRELDEAKALSDEEKQRADELRTEMTNLRRAQDELSEQISEKERALRSIDFQIKSGENVIARLRQIGEDWEQLLKQPMPAQPLPVIKRMQHHLESRERDAITKQDSAKGEISALEARTDMQQDVLRLIEGVEEGTEAVCPVCKRELTPTLINQIRQDCSRMIQRLKQEQQQIEVTLPELGAAIARIRSRKNALSKIEGRIQESMELGMATFEMSDLEAKLKSLRETEKKKRREMAEPKARLAECQEEMARHKIGLEELEKRASKERHDEIRRALVASLKGQFISSELMDDSLHKALTDQRTSVLGPLMSELSRELSRFLQMEVDARLKDDAQLAILDKRTRQELIFPQLSGGEKTALLAFTQMFLCKYFSNADFMLLDEPLEHLDPDNRRGLIDFLVASGKAGYPKQLIITTFEETLLRQHFDDPLIRITYLSRDHPPVSSGPASL